MKPSSAETNTTPPPTFPFPIPTCQRTYPKAAETASSGTYASTFYTIIGAHAVNVSLGVVWLVAVLIRAWLGYYSSDNYTGVTTCGMYWHLVVGLWPALFYLVYLL